MAIGKEIIFNLRHLRNQEILIYPDAADRGVFETPAVRQLIVGCMEELKALEGVHSTRWGNRKAGGVSCQSRLGYETDMGMVRGLKIVVTKNWTTAFQRPYYDIHFEPAVWREDSAVNEFGPMYQTAC